MSSQPEDDQAAAPSKPSRSFRSSRQSLNQSSSNQSTNQSNTQSSGQSGSQSSGSFGSFWKRAGTFVDSVKANVSEKIAVAANTAAINVSSSKSTMLHSMLNSVAAAATTSQSNNQSTNQSTPQFTEIDVSGMSFKPYHHDVMIQDDELNSASIEADSALMSTMSLLSHISDVLNDAKGGYLTPNVFFPADALHDPSLKWPALSLKLTTLQKFDELCQNISHITQQSTESIEQQAEHWKQAVADLDKLQNELAFALPYIQETHMIQATSPPPTSTTLHEEGEDPNEAFEEIIAGTVTQQAEKLSDRFRSLGYSIAKSASRMSKQVMAEKVSATHINSYIKHVASISHSAEQLSVSFIKQRHLRLPPRPDEDIHLTPAQCIISAYHRWASFVRDVMLAFVLDDLHLALSRYMKEQHALFMQEPVLQLFRREEEDANANVETITV